MLSMILMGSLITAVGVLSIMAKASPKFLKLVLGYEVWVDLFMSVMLSIYVATTGTISGMVIGATTGVFIGATLFVAARTIGYIRFTRNEEGKFTLKEFPPSWTVANFLDAWNKWSAKYNRAPSRPLKYIN